MRTLEEVNNLLSTYKEKIKLTDPTKDFVITADSMTVNRNARGRYEIGKVDFPTVYEKGAAEWRRNTEAAKNNLITFRVVRYKKWLEKEISKLESLVNASNVAQGAVEDVGVEEHEDEVEEIKEVETDILEGTTEQLEETPENSIYNITQIVNKKCPIGSNNCLCCIYCDNIKLVNHICSIECKYKAE